MKPRPYQLEAKTAVYRAFKRGARSALVVAATGLGKGAIIGMIVGDAVKAGKRVLVFVHRQEIVDQLAGHVRAWSGLEAAIEQGPRAEATSTSPVVVASVQSIVRRFDRFPADRFDLLVYDECHRALGAQPREVMRHFDRARVVGLTATPNRGDERALGQVFDEVVFEMPIDVAVREGWLVPLRIERIKLRSLDLSDVRRSHGDLVRGDLGVVMSTIDVMREAVVPALERAGHLKTLVFTCTRPHMLATVECIRQVAAERLMPLTVEYVDGETPLEERRQIFARFRSGQTRWLVGVDVFSEGVDVPDVEAVVRLRPTESRVVYTQQLGRGARPLPGVVDGVTVEDMAVRLDELMASGRLPTNPDGWIAGSIAGVHRGDRAAARRLAIALSAKRECLVLDFTDSDERIDLADGMDALGGDYNLPERREAERILASGGARHLLEALELARMAKAAELREARAKAGDPFALFDLPSRTDKYERLPTAKHRKILDPMRLPNGHLDWRQSNDLCAELARREAADLAMYEQVHLLARLGCPLDWLSTMARREASAMICQVALEGWRRPSDWTALRAGD